MLIIRTKFKSLSCIISLLQVLNHLHKKLKNVSKKSEISKKKVGGGLFLSLLSDVKVPTMAACIDIELK